MPAIASLPGICDVTHIRGAQAPAGAVPDLLIEVPHGATRAAHFDLLRQELRGPFPADLRDFFFVNTDVGAPEAALALAAQVTAAAPGRAVTVVRSLIPRTFIDCNRVIDRATLPTTSTAGGMTPGIVRYVTDPADLALLFARYAAYVGLVTQAFEEVCGAGGTGVMLHSYAPRSVDVPVDERIVERLHAAYQPDVEPTWPLRAEVDFITRTPDGTLLADPALVAAARAAFAALGVGTADGAAYPLHPSTVAATFAARWPGQTLCLELRRDLLVPRFTPFLEMVGDPAKCARMAGPIATALLEWWASPNRGPTA